MIEKYTQGELFSVPTFPHGETDLQTIDTVRGRSEFGDCRNDDGVSLWDLIEYLKRDGVKRVKFI